MSAHTALIPLTQKPSSTDNAFDLENGTVSSFTFSHTHDAHMHN